MGAIYEIIKNLQMIRQTLCDNTELIKQKKELQDEIGITVDLTQSIVAENSRKAQNQDEYNKKYNGLVERYNNMKNEYDKICSDITSNEVRCKDMGRFIDTLIKRDGIISEFDENLWSSLVDHIVVKSKTDIMVIFKNGTEIKI